MSFRKSFEVRWADIDVNWHMRNTAYAELGTNVRFTYLSQKGFPPEEFEKLRFGPVILREETRYLREVRLNMTLTVTFELSGISHDGSHFELHHDMFLEDGATAATSRVEGSWLDLGTRKLRAAPAPLLDALLELDKTEDFRTLKPLARNSSA